MGKDYEHKKQVIPWGAYEIELMVDSSFNPDSANNLYQYQSLHIEKEWEELTSPNANRGVFTKRFIDGEKEMIHSLFIGNTGAGDRLHPQSFWQKADRLFLIVGHFLYALQLPHLSLLWKNQVDHITCFSLHPYAEGLLIHGEFQISHWSWEGHCNWKYQGRDIFVTYEEGLDFKIEGDLIRVKDFSDHVYYLNAQGKEIRSYKDESN
ncbi:MAG: hypothetical protein AAFU64_01880 [Bacteroidota bacterium]